MTNNFYNIFTPQSIYQNTSKNIKNLNHRFNSLRIMLRQLSIRSDIFKYGDTQKKK
jgi:hypothetical protein